MRAARRGGHDLEAAAIARRDSHKIGKYFPAIYNADVEDERVSQVILGEDERIESALRRFKRQVSKSGILTDVKKHQYFETPAEKRKRKALAARRSRRLKH
ncbi:MAG TPA: 30S ribosomal protein S21 [Candidatus Caenarcaniphilales bacterium]